MMISFNRLSKDEKYLIERFLESSYKQGFLESLDRGQREVFEFLRQLIERIDIRGIINDVELLARFRVELKGDLDISFLGMGVLERMNLIEELDRYRGYKSYIKNIEESIWIILGFPPYFFYEASNLYEIVFEIINDDSLNELCDRIKRSLTRWENRIYDIQVDADIDPNREDRILVNLRFKLRANYEERCIVFPFYFSE